jgi:hypothetical protein
MHDYAAFGEMMTTLRQLFSVTFALVFTTNAQAWTHNLVEDLGIRGVMRYCKYSNGMVYAVNAADICQISIEDSAPGFGQGQGFLKGEYRDGMTKVCVYDVLGERRAVRINSTPICPLGPKF